MKMKQAFFFLLLLLSTPAGINAKERRSLRNDNEKHQYIAPTPSPAEGDDSAPVEAIDIDQFALIDQNLFEWVNPEEITPGNTTCGFLKSDLGSLPNVTYPKVMVYVCVQFALNQPAPKGNLAVHCGGPGSLSSCVNSMGSAKVLGLDNVNDYNVIGIDQRGTGRSYPSFAHEECTFGVGKCMLSHCWS
jgi:hypothetical protein